MKKATIAALASLCLMAALAVSSTAQDRPESVPCVNGVCYPDPLTVTISIPDTATLVQILAQQHIADTEANRTLVVNELVHEYLRDHASRNGN
jgi:hypothetical protein